MNKLGASDATMGGTASRIPAKQVTPEEGAALLRAQGGTLTAQVQIVRRGAWKTVAADGYPEAESHTQFFCWALGFDQPVILEFWPGDSRTEFLRAPCFGDDGGAWTEITHYMPIDYPNLPAIETHTLTMGDQPKEP